MHYNFVYSIIYDPKIASFYFQRPVPNSSDRNSSMVNVHNKFRVYFKYVKGLSKTVKNSILLPKELGFSFIHSFLFPK